MAAAYAYFHYWCCFLQRIHLVKVKKKTLQEKRRKTATVIMLQGRVTKADVTLLNASLGPEEVFLSSQKVKDTRNFKLCTCVTLFVCILLDMQ